MFKRLYCGFYCGFVHPWLPYITKVRRLSRVTYSVHWRGYTLSFEKYA